MQGLSQKRPLVLGRHQAGLYFLHSNQNNNNGIALSVTSHAPSDPAVIFSNSVCMSDDNLFSLWHNRLGHLPMYKLKTLSFLSNKNATFNHACEICSKARQHKLPFGHSVIKTSSSFDLIHIDTWGPYNTRTYNGKSYFLTIVDDFSRSTWTHLLSTKGNSFNVLKGFIEMVKT